MIDPTDNLPQDDRLDRRRFVAAPELPQGSLDRLRARIDERVNDASPRRRRSIGGAVGALTLAAAAAVATIVWLGGDEASEWAGARFDSGGEGGELSLPDGSRIEAEPHTALELLEADRGLTRIALREGRATFDVSHRPERAFVVEAGTLRVRVLGTRFRVTYVERDGFRDVRVTVERGRVEVTPEGGEPRQLGAGDRFSSTEQLERAGRDENRAAERPKTPVAPQEGSSTGEGHDGETDAAAGAGARRPHAPGRHRRQERARAEAAAAADLFERATGARRDGQPATAARHYERFVNLYPKDRRTPLAAFELGRLQMDALGNPGAAERALRTALSEGRGSPFRQDAMARIVELYDQSGRQQACRRARAAYLEAFPEGRYEPDVRGRCEAR